MKNRQQMELGLNQNSRPVRPARRQRPRVSARWWFQQMHAVVDRAPEWNPARDTNARQVDLTLAGSH